VGWHNDYRSLAFMFYKIAYDYYWHKSDTASSTFLSKLTEYVFEKKEPGLKELTNSSGCFSNLWKSASLIRIR
jgi:hypothetical protein